MAGKKSALVATYEEAVQRLDELAQEEADLGNLDRASWLRNLAAELKEWLDGGRQGSCPVDLTTEGIQVEETAYAEAVIIEGAGETLATEAPFPEEAEQVAEPLPETSSTDLPEVTVEESPVPELSKAGLSPDLIRQQIETIQSYRERGEIRDAFNLCKELSEQLPKGQPERERIDNLLYEIEGEFKRKIAETLEKGHLALREGKYEEARKHYEEVLRLDSDNPGARRALLELDGKLTGEMDEARRRELLRGLREQRDIRILGDAVYWAETLEREGLADAEILALLPDARRRFDELRTAMGQEVSLARTGTLKQRYEALKAIQERVMRGDTWIWDPTTNQYVESYKKLEEAQRAVYEASDDFMRYKMDLATSSLPHRPRTAKRHLEELLAEDNPLHEDHRHRAEEMLTMEVMPRLEELERAEDLMERSRQTDDPLERFNLQLEARQVFPYIEGWERLVSQTRVTALNQLKIEIERLHGDAKGFIGRANSVEKKQADAYYENARQCIHKAREWIAKWPEPELASELRTLEEHSRELEREVTEAQSLREEFEQQVEQVRGQVRNPNKREAGLDLFKRMRQKSAYRPFGRFLDNLETELLSLRSIGDQIRELERAVDERKWEQAVQIGNGVLESGQVGEQSEHVCELLDQARAHLQVEEARRHLKEQNIPEAKKCLEWACSKVPELRKQLTEEFKQIEEAEEDSHMGKLYEEATRNWQHANYQRKLEILKTLRHIGGLEDFAEELNLPPFKISLFTYKAKQEAREREKELREELLPPIMSYYKLES